VILILIEAGLFRRIFPPLVWLGVFIAFSGSVLLGYSDARSETLFEHALLGDMYALIAAVLFALYFLISQHLRQKSDWLNYVVRVYGATGMTCLAVALFSGSDFRVEPVVWVAGVALALGPQVIGHGSMNYAVKFVAPTFLATLIITEPVFATILAWFLFSEIPPWLTFPAMAIILMGVILTWAGRKKNNNLWTTAQPPVIHGWKGFSSIQKSLFLLRNSNVPNTTKAGFFRILESVSNKRKQVFFCFWNHESSTR
jgi:drug/metabolite transporter (DMT)-like permease